MKCLVLSFLMGYNGQIYKKGDYVEVADEESVKRLVRERCISCLPLVKTDAIKKEEDDFPSTPSSIMNAKQKAIEEKAEKARGARGDGAKTQVRTVKKGAKKQNG